MDPGGPARDCWPTLPFELDAGCRALTVELEYDPAGGAVIDLGCAGPAGWRGWSGAARHRYVITADAATPGYLPGELEEGTWHVVLGLHRLPEAGRRSATWPGRLPLAGRRLAGHGHVLMDHDGAVIAIAGGLV